MNFKAQNVMLILAGVILLAVEFMVPIAGTKVDVFNDIVAYILILVGIKDLTKRNNIFKKCRNMSMVGVLSSAFAQFVYMLDMKASQANAELFVKGISTIVFIYVTYYFMESVALEAKMQDKTAVAQNFRVTWIVFGVFIFAYFIILNFEVASIIEIVAQAVMIMCGIYYCNVMLAACKQLYMDGLPPHAMSDNDKKI